MSHEFKYIFVGECGVGKSSIVQKFIDPESDPEGLPATLDVQQFTAEEEVDGETYAISLWDTTGEEKFRSVTSAFYKGAQGAFAVFDVTDRDSFECADKWLNEALRYCGSDVITFIVGNKVDCADDRVVSREEGEELCKKVKNSYETTYVETTIFDVETINKMIKKMTKQVVKSLAEGNGSGSEDGNGGSGSNGSKKGDGGDKNKGKGKGKDKAKSEKSEKSCCKVA